MANLAQRVGAPQLAEHHRDKLTPTAKAAGMALGFSFLNQQLKVAARKKLENLTEHAYRIDSCWASCFSGSLG